MGVLGSIVSAYGAHKVNKSQQRFARDMSGTAHQREVEDLRLAGLNPILSGMGGSGASTPTITPQNVGKAGVEGGLTSASIKKINAETDLTKEKTKVVAPTANVMDQINSALEALKAQFGSNKTDGIIPASATRISDAIKKSDQAKVIRKTPGIEVTPHVTKSLNKLKKQRRNKKRQQNRRNK